MLSKKNIILCISGGIASYKIANLASMLKKQNANIYVIMTKNAQKFITPTTFEALTHTRCITDTFDRNHEFSVEHISLAKIADLILIAPATANIIGKIANGIADDILTTTVLATKSPILVAPAMNTQMFSNKIVQNNIKKLIKYGFEIIEPTVGYLACGDIGAGKMAEPNILLEHILNKISLKKDMKNLSVLITAGATMESIDPVRFITNHSTGKMGYSIAKIAYMRGANVTLISGKTNLEKPIGINYIETLSAKDMFEAVIKHKANKDIIIKSAAVSDFTPQNIYHEKIKKNDSLNCIPVKKTTDILKYLGKEKKTEFLCGFAMETENLLKNAKKKLFEKNLDMIVANSLKDDGAGFGTETNIATIITKNEEISLPIMKKEELAIKILDNILLSINKK